MRPFDLQILDNFQREVIHLYRPLRCDSCCCPCCLQSLEVTAPPGTIIGYVTQEWSICYPKYRIENAAKECVLRIEGPCCTFSICGDVEFKVLAKDGQTIVGRITKQWSGFAKEAFTDADNFGINFPMDLDVNIKAVLLGACFLIVSLYFCITCF
ncbi:phospholipid scramblase 1-like [Centruroides sculpturatus]|uniref:phospholipid scramblase 1-like n=1 Tax=Centruroides sculpturatus TaxID=218467 RepID=UPI000C6D5F60|nr:phospholipid scramblase 1-like [Centruroides sculpturatus]